MDRLLSIAREEGCTLTEKTTCVMITRGKSDNRLYVAKTQNVARVNVNGFKIPDPEVAKSPEGGPVGTFLQVIRFDHPEPKVLENFRSVCRGLDQYAPEEKKKRGRPAGLKGSKREEAPGPALQVVAAETPEEHAERLVREYRQKKSIAAQMGYPLSRKTVAEYIARAAELGVSLEA